jgi:hypothetical protein
MSTSTSDPDFSQTSILDLRLRLSVIQQELLKATSQRKAASTHLSALASQLFRLQLMTSSLDLEPSKRFWLDRLMAARRCLSTAEVALGYVAQCLADIDMPNQKPVSSSHSRTKKRALTSTGNV